MALDLLVDILHIAEVLRVLHLVHQLLSLQVIYLLLARLDSLGPQLIVLLQTARPRGQQFLHLGIQIEYLQNLRAHHLPGNILPLHSDLLLYFQDDLYGLVCLLGYKLFADCNQSFYRPLVDFYYPQCCKSRILFEQSSEVLFFDTKAEVVDAVKLLPNLFDQFRLLNIFLQELLLRVEGFYYLFH